MQRNVHKEDGRPVCAINTVMGGVDEVHCLAWWWCGGCGVATKVGAGASFTASTKPVPEGISAGQEEHVTHMTACVAMY